MTATLPSIAKLKPYPKWSKLPLFNRKNWTRVRFGDVVENVNDTESNPTELRDSLPEPLAPTEVLPEK